MEVEKPASLISLAISPRRFQPTSFFIFRVWAKYDRTLDDPECKRVDEVEDKLDYFQHYNKFFKTMKSKFPTDGYFRQYVGIDVSSKFTACLCMLSWGCPAQFTESIEFANTKTGFNQLVKWARREAEGKPILCFLMEPTGTYYEDLAYPPSQALVYGLCVIPSGRVHAFFRKRA